MGNRLLLSDSPIFIVRDLSLIFLLNLKNSVCKTELAKTFKRSMYEFTVHCLFEYYNAVMYRITN